MAPRAGSGLWMKIVAFLALVAVISLLPRSGPVLQRHHMTADSAAGAAAADFRPADSGAGVATAGGRPAGSTAVSAAAAGANRILVLYHITAHGNWQAIVDDQATKLIYSGLYAQLSRVHCAVYGASPSAASDAATLLSGYGRKFEVVGLSGLPSVSQSIASLDMDATDRILFLSTYGAAAPAGSPAAHAAFLWRTLMEYSLVKDYRRCLLKLRKKDIVGPFISPSLPFSPLCLGDSSARYLPRSSMQVQESCTA